MLEQCQGVDRAKSWLRLEHTRQISHWLPWRPSANESDDDCEDPHRLVLSDDIIAVLFYVPGDCIVTCWRSLHSTELGQFTQYILF